MSDASPLPFLERRPVGTERLKGTLVLIHGFPLNAHMWEPQLALADHGWRVLAPHLRGMGGPEVTTTPTIDDYAGDVVDFLDAQHVDEAVIMGLSMGGYISLALMRMAPRYIRGLVLADTRPQADTPEAVEGRRRMLASIEQRGVAGVAAVADDMLPKLLSEQTRTRQPEVVDTMRGLILSNTPAGVAGAVSALMTRPDSTATLKTIHCPTLIIVGEHDAITPPALSQGMHEAIPGSELVVIPGAGHMPNLEQPAAFNAALARFLEHRV
jgi:pimeloyl-ACP methyl ester carboxylesterase